MARVAVLERLLLAAGWDSFSLEHAPALQSSGKGVLARFLDATIDRRRRRRRGTWWAEWNTCLLLELVKVGLVAIGASDVGIARAGRGVDAALALLELGWRNL
jgi:hypothetical protein